MVVTVSVCVCVVTGHIFVAIQHVQFPYLLSYTQMHAPWVAGYMNNRDNYSNINSNMNIMLVSKNPQEKQQNSIYC